MDMSTLIKTEHDNWKKRMMVETCGTYILMNMGMGFVVIAGAFCGVMNTEFDLYYYNMVVFFTFGLYYAQSRYCLLYTSPSPRDRTRSRMPSSA